MSTIPRHIDIIIEEGQVEEAMGLKAKLAFVTGAAVGYVFGTRAGREKFDRMTAHFQQVWDRPEVQEQVDRAGRAVADTVRTQRESLTRRATETVKDTLGLTPPRAAGPPPPD